MSSVITIHQDQQEQEEFGLATLFASPPMVLKPTIVVPPPLPPKSSKGLTSTATKLDALFASESCTQPPVALSFDNEGVGLAYQSVVDLTGDDPIERLTPVRTKPTTEKRNRPRRRQLVIKTEDDATKTSHSFAMENVDSIAGHNQVDHSSSSADALVCRHDPSVRIGLRVAQASPNIIRIKQEPNSELGKGSKVVIDLTQDSPTTPRPQPRRRPPPVSIKKFKQKNNLAISTSIVSPLAIVIKQEDREAHTLQGGVLSARDLPKRIHDVHVKQEPIGVEMELKNKDQVKHEMSPPPKKSLVQHDKKSDSVITQVKSELMDMPPLEVYCVAKDHVVPPDNAISPMPMSCLPVMSNNQEWFIPNKEPSIETPTSFGLGMGPLPDCSLPVLSPLLNMTPLQTSSDLLHLVEHMNHEINWLPSPSYVAPSLSDSVNQQPQHGPIQDSAAVDTVVAQPSPVQIRQTRQKSRRTKTSPDKRKQKQRVVEQNQSSVLIDVKDVSNVVNQQKGDSPSDSVVQEQSLVQPLNSMVEVDKLLSTHHDSVVPSSLLLDLVPSSAPPDMRGSLFADAQASVEIDRTRPSHGSGEEPFPPSHVRVVVEAVQRDELVMDDPFLSDSLPSIPSGKEESKEPETDHTVSPLETSPIRLRRSKRRHTMEKESSSSSSSSLSDDPVPDKRRMFGGKAPRSEHGAIALASTGQGPAASGQRGGPDDLDAEDEKQYLVSVPIHSNRYMEQHLETMESLRQASKHPRFKHEGSRRRGTLYNKPVMIPPFEDGWCTVFAVNNAFQRQRLTKQDMLHARRFFQARYPNQKAHVDVSTTKGFARSHLLEALRAKNIPFKLLGNVPKGKLGKMESGPYLVFGPHKSPKQYFAADPQPNGLEQKTWIRSKLDPAGHHCVALILRGENDGWVLDNARSEPIMLRDHAFDQCFWRVEYVIRLFEQ